MGNIKGMKFNYVALSEKAFTTEKIWIIVIASGM
jgi:hypothetical protein